MRTKKATWVNNYFPILLQYILLSLQNSGWGNSNKENQIHLAFVPDFVNKSERSAFIDASMKESVELIFLQIFSKLEHYSFFLIFNKCYIGYID